MREQTFSLKQFREDSSGIAISGRIARCDNILIVRYELIGSLQNIDIPDRKQKPSRVKGLWENTCFELFVAPGSLDQYWEINISPSGDWNVFRFENYEEVRHIHKLREEHSVASLPSRTQQISGSLLLDFEFDLDRIIREDQLLETGISAVVKFHNRKTYWALAHCDPEPNFHKRDSFILKL